MFEKPENLLGDILWTLLPSADFLKSQKPRRPRRPAPVGGTRVRVVRGKNWYRDKLACELGGQTAVPVPGGHIDILTSTEIVEVNAAAQWIEALDQIELYGRFYPNHHRRIHLFGKLPVELSQLEVHCQSRSVRVTWVA